MAAASAQSPRRIAVLQLKRIGDAVLTAPALGSLRSALPGSRITLVLAGAAGGLGPLFGMADEVRVWRPGRLNAGLVAAVVAGGYDLVLDFSGTDRSAFLALASRAGMRAGYAKFIANGLRRRAWNLLCDASVRELHTIDLHHALVRACGIAAPDVPDAGHLTLPAGVDLPPLPPEYAVVHPGTARSGKFWQAAGWSRVIRHVQSERGLPVVLTGSDGLEEAAHLSAIRDGLGGDPVIDLSGKLDLVQLAAVIAGAQLAVGPDTAAMHLASSFRRPQVVLYGPTNPWHWQPRHDRARILCAGDPENRLAGPHRPPAPMDRLTPGEVIAAVDSLAGN